MSLGLRTIWSLTLLASLLVGGRLAAQESVPQAAEAEVVTAPVALDGTVLFRVRGVSSYPAAVRARLIRNQLTAVASNEAIPVDSIHAVEADGMTRVVAGTLPIMTVVEADASLEQVGRVELATVHVTRIREAVVAYRAARTPAALRRRGRRLSRGHRGCRDGRDRLHAGSGDGSTGCSGAFSRPGSAPSRFNRSR